MLFFVAQGFRVVAHDRRGHGRSTQVSDGHDMDHYAADASAVAEHLNLKNAVHIGHSTGGGEVARYVAKYGEPQGRVAKAVLISAVPPLMLKTDNNPGGTPIEVFDGFRKALAANRSQFYLDVASGPFYGFNRPGANDQVVLYKDAPLLQAKLLKNSTLKVYPGFSHGMCTANADVINSDLLAFIRS